MAYTRLNPETSSGTPTAGQSDVSTGFNWWFRYGDIVVANVNFKDATPAANEAVLKGFPAPSQRVTMSIVCGVDPRRMFLDTDGKLYWDNIGTNNWSQMNFSYQAS